MATHAENPSAWLAAEAATLAYQRTTSRANRDESWKLVSDLIDSPTFRRHVGSRLRIPLDEQDDFLAGLRERLPEILEKWRPGRGRLSTFVYAVAAKRAIDWHRRRIRTSVEVPWPDHWEPRDEAVAISVEERLDLLAALQRVSAADQEVLVYKALGLTAEEVGTRLGIAPEAAKKRIQRAVKRLRVELQGG